MQESIETLRTELEERLRFETLLAEISARFVNLPADRIDSEIEDAQRRICEFLDLDRSSLGQVPEREPGVTATDPYPSVSGKPASSQAAECKGFLSLDGPEGPGWGDGRYYENVRPPTGSRPRSGEFRSVRNQVRCGSSVISWRRASIWPVDIQCHAGGEGLAGNGREGLPAYCASVCQRARPETR